MKTSASPWSRRRCGAFLALLASASALSAGEVLLDEVFADGDRATLNLPASAAWFLQASSPAYSESVTPGAWTLQSPPAPSRVGFLTHLPAAVLLKPGESLTLTVTFKPGDRPAGWALGLFDSRGARVSADTVGKAGANWRGFAGEYSAEMSGLSVAGRFGAGQDLWSKDAYRRLGFARQNGEGGPSVTLCLSRSSKDEWALSLHDGEGRCSAVAAAGPDSFDTIAWQFAGRSEPVTVTRVLLEKDPGAENGVSLAADGERTSAGLQALRALPAGSRWYLQFSQTSPSQNWNTLTTWFSATAGGGSNPASILSTDVFDLNRRRVISPAIASGTTIFGGGAMVMGTSGTISLVGSNSTTTVIPYLVASGGIITNSGGALQSLTISELETSAGALTVSTGAASRTLVLTSSTLTGSGTLIFGGAGRHQFQAVNAHNFSGELNFSTGTMTFLNNLSTSGRLMVRDTYRIHLTRAISCAGLTVSGTAVAPQPGEAPGAYRFSPGTYTYATLNAMFPAVFVSGSTGGSITVRTGTTYYLKVDQAQGRNWTSTCASDWNTSPSAGGTNAPAVGPLDDFSTNGRLLRTPSTSHIFDGRTLMLHNGAIALKNPRPEVATIPTLLATSGTIMQYLNTSGTASLKVNFLTQNSGTTHLVATAGQTLDLNIDYLSGNGNLRFASAGQSLFTVTDASQFTGTYTQASGTLRLAPITSGPIHAVGAPLAMKGRLVVDAGASVVLDRDVYVGGLTVGGTARANGTYTAASLGFSGSARVTVLTPDLSAPTALFGVNLPSAHFDYYGGNAPLNPVIWNYYQQKGLTLIRAAFDWEQVQPTLNGPLNTTFLGLLNTMLARAQERNMKVFFDMHNYGQFNGQNIGTAAVPYSAYQDVWQKLSAYFAASPYKSALYGYDIMNEPNKLGLGDGWPTAAKYAIAGIRANDLTSYLVAEGKYWAGAHNWDIYNGDIGFIDPACRVIYSAHSYWDSDASGTKYSTTYQEGVDYLNKGVDRLKPFVTWITKRKFRGLIGEYGVPTNPFGASPAFVPDPRWHTMLDRALSYMQDNGISGTYWSGGYGWGTYNLLSDTIQNGQPVDAPVMSILQNYSQ